MNTNFFEEAGKNFKYILQKSQNLDDEYLYRFDSSIFATIC
jgi:hypothetical protein